MSGLRYVYAICRPFSTPLQAELTGVAGGPPKLLRHGGLVAVVSSVPEEDFAEAPLRAHLEDLDWLGATARGHQSVIDALTVVTSPLPLRLATVFRDDSGVRVMMQEREEAFLRTLDRLDGRVEWGVKVYAEQSEASGGSRSPETSPEASPAGAGGAARSGRDYLRQRRMQRQAHEDRWEQAEAFAQRFHTTLREHAEDARVHAPQNAALSGVPGRNVLNAAYLVPRSRSEAFVELVDRTKDEAGPMRVELTGPWAAYSFSGEQT
ncbi:GvpL/GvpF family gas vesicle protein [Streptomyces sp. NPDC008313]|uniref:GvpL/GvpF family gas vesicle protein n=1 Tax=Streptomyces sp. NPDC008313 TaxID=3364826 RepID=UPI0036F0E906